MDWKDEIRKTIFRQVPNTKEAVYEAMDPKQLHKYADDLPIWEKTAHAVREELLFSDEKELDHAEEASGNPEDISPEDAPKDASDEKSQHRKGDVYDEAREWLFKENMRLEALRAELSKASKMMQEQAAQLKEDGLRLEEEKKLFAKEKEEFKEEMKDWNEQIKNSRKKLADDQSLFDKKYKVLEMGFAKLNEDKKAFESQKRAFEYKKKFFGDVEQFASLDSGSLSGGDILFFKGVSHPMAIKKRYKDLIKIYHPDNTDGDKYILQRINQEYDRIRRYQQ